MVKLISVNIRGLSNPKKRRAVFDYYRVNADVLILQETHSSPQIENIWENEWGGKAIYAHGTSQARGIAILLSRKCQFTTSNILRDINGRYVIVDITEDEQTVTLVVVYAPNEDNPQFFRKISQELESRSEQKIIVGDFNLTLDVGIDRLNTYHNNNLARDEVLNMMEQYCLVEIWRIRNEEKKEYSWIKTTERTQPRKASRIDFMLISAGLDQRVELVMYLTGLMTDHRAFYCSLMLNSSERGTGYWKLNTSLLQEESFLTGVREEISKTLSSNGHKKPDERWEDVKSRTKKYAIKYSRNKSSEEKLIISNLSEAVNQYETMLPLPLEQDKIYEDSKADLEDKQLQRTLGIMFRSKAKWYELGERNSKYFFSLEKAKYNQKTCF